MDYYIRLEQGRGAHPSRQVLSALSRALMLTADEREYLFRIAGEAPPQVPRPSREIMPGIRHLLDSMPDVSAFVVDAAYNVLAWNQLAVYFIGDMSMREAPEHGPLDVPPCTGRPALARHGNDVLRPVHDRRPARRLRSLPGRSGIESLVTELLALSPKFAQLWAEHEVEVRGRMVKHLSVPRGRPAGVRVPGAAHRRHRPADYHLLRRSRLIHGAGLQRLAAQAAEPGPRRCLEQHAAAARWPGRRTAPPSGGTAGVGPAYRSRTCPSTWPAASYPVTVAGGIKPLLGTVSAHSRMPLPGQPATRWAV